MIRCKGLARREALHSAGIPAAAALAAFLSPDVTFAHHGHDHATRAPLDLKSKRVRIVGPGEDSGILAPGAGGGPRGRGRRGEPRARADGAGAVWPLHRGRASAWR
ncbi:hypothetical protein DF3PB_20069 [uncultured Defluviicoccus sp.]|uniref:Uncharacterized protein n=1 Tax=metagenome TaxID=256318 RepID=A0A380TDF4_9ZZZZ|nr:hypothetical protein DF3PB_20069 [uncultured Defluviicoccus sp.]